MKSTVIVATALACIACGNSERLKAAEQFRASACACADMACFEAAAGRYERAEETAKSSRYDATDIESAELAGYGCGAKLQPK